MKNILHYNCEHCKQEYELTEDITNGYLICIQCKKLTALPKKLIKINQPINLSHISPNCYHFKPDGSLEILTREQVEKNHKQRSWNYLYYMLDTL